MTSEIVQLRKARHWTTGAHGVGLAVDFKSTGKVIYAGLYSITRVPDEAGPLREGKLFPAYGSPAASVYLRPVGKC